jgi:hypothetical protein
MKTILASLALAALGAIGLCASAAEKRADPLPKELSAYTSWQRVNPKPLRLPDLTALDCAAPRPERIANPHQNYWFTVYVNPTGEKAMRKPTSPVFPTGSILVKEKLPEKTSSAPELRTAMIKRERGFDKEAGDWEYLVIDGEGKVTRSKEETAHCRSCHERSKGNDYVFRTYLPKPATRKSIL